MREGEGMSQKQQACKQIDYERRLGEAETKIYNPRAVDEPWEKIVHELTRELRGLLAEVEVKEND